MTCPWRISQYSPVMRLHVKPHPLSPFAKASVCRVLMTDFNFSSLRTKKVKTLENRPSPTWKTIGRNRVVVWR